MLEISQKDYLKACAEHDRLIELRDYAISGTQAEPRFDAIARAAGTLFKTPMAFLTLIDEDRQWFKASIGLEIKETPRSVSFCTHTIMSSDVMVVHDAALDQRFATSPLVTEEPKIRFYAGAPLVTDEGFRLGALCVVDTVPREEFSQEQREALKDLAALAMSQIAGRRHESSALALAGLAECVGQPLIAVSHSGRIEFANRPAAEFFGCDVGELNGLPMDNLISAGRLGAGAHTLLAVFQNAQSGVVSHPFKRVARMGDGSEVPVEISVSRWDAANGTGIAVVLHDLSLRTTTEPTAPVLAAEEGSDVVLGRLLDAAIMEEKSSGLLMVSLDGLEELCDELGENNADLALRSISTRLHSLFPTGAVIVRGKGDDFALLVETVKSPAEGHAAAQKIVQSFEEIIDIGVRPLRVTTSVGFAMLPIHGDTARELIANATFALHAARRGGVNRVQMYDEAMRARSVERHQIQLELAQALRNDEFRLFYQPQVSLVDGSILGVEALIRWQHPRRGLLQPQAFLLDIEESNLSLPIGWWTLETACAQLAAWRAEGLPTVHMGVNLFPAQFRSEMLVPRIADLLSRYSLDPDLLELEVTETIALLNDDVGLRSFRQLRDMGVGIAFDDFGTGYASLSSLQQFPLTTLKLDRAFIRDLLTDHNDAVITRSMISMANELQLATIAEGIETTEQEDFLRFLGCKAGQGYLYSKPICAEEMARMLGDGRGEQNRSNVLAYA